jgi:hypothetical protein
MTKTEHTGNMATFVIAVLGLCTYFFSDNGSFVFNALKP